MFRVLRRPLSIVLAVLAAVVPVGAVALASAVGPGGEAAAVVGQENTNANSNLGYLFAIYLITWAGFFVYVFVTSRRQRALEREISELKQLLAERTGQE